MNKKRKQRLKELGKIIDVAQREVREIWSDISIERYEALVGKFFKCWEDTSDSHWLYLAPFEIDEFGHLKGDWIKVHDCFGGTGRVQFSNPKEMDFLDSYAGEGYGLIEIPRNEYIDIVKNIIMDIENI